MKNKGVSKPNQSKMQSNRRTVNSSVVKSCKFCKDAGKSEEEYTSHFLRESKDPNSRVTCPTLLAIECRYCFKKGHTISKCQKLAKVKDGSQQKIPNAPIKKAMTTQISPMNPFDLLSEFGDSDKEDDDDVVSITTGTTCQECDTMATGSSNGTLTYAEMLAKPAPQVVVVQKFQAEVGSRISIISKARMMRSWADFSDSDEE